MNMIKAHKINPPDRAVPKLFFCLYLIFLLAVIPAGYSLAAEEDDLTAMTQYANNNLLEILSNIPIGEEEYYGFHNRDEINQAALGIPYQEYDLDQEQPTGYWRVPVTVDGENRALLRLINTAEGWAFAGLGGAQLARNLDDQETYMISQGTTPSTGRIVRDFSMRCDYVQFDQQHNASLSGTVYPLWSAYGFISTFGNNGRARVANYAGYDLDAIKEMRLKAQETMGAPNSFGNSGWGN
ncbi:MAG: hypothetical protein PVJ68_04195 [Candidatus Thiodiazotropha sp.]|jgi:hypothetical protein